MSLDAVGDILHSLGVCLALPSNEKSIHLEKKREKRKEKRREKRKEEKRKKKRKEKRERRKEKRIERRKEIYIIWMQVSIGVNKV
jgi:hypothetical protein